MTTRKPVPRERGVSGGESGADLLAGLDGAGVGEGFGDAGFETFAE